MTTHSKEPEETGRTIDLNIMKLEPATIKTIIVTDERRRILDNDPVWSFFMEVNKAEIEKPYWKQDFRRAFYDTAHEKINEYAIKLIEKTEAAS